MKSDPSIAFWASMSVIRSMILLGSRNDAEVAEVCRAANIDLADLSNLEKRVPLDANITVTQKLLELTGDKDLGLHIGEKAAPPMLGKAGHLQLSSKDVLSAFKKTFDFSQTFTSVFNSRYEEKSPDIWLYYEPVKGWVDASPETASQWVSLTFAATMNFIRLMSGRIVYPLQIIYRSDRVKDTSEHERLFRCTPKFNQEGNCMLFRIADLQVQTLGYNPQLSIMIEKMLQEQVREADSGVRFTTKVKEAISANYEYDFPQLETVALTLNVTPRTLQRKLQDENTTYRELSDSIRYELAATLLKYKDLTVSEIAYKLGYSELRNFRIAFKQWSGLTPMDYRQGNVRS